MSHHARRGRTRREGNDVVWEDNQIPIQNLIFFVVVVSLSLSFGQAHHTI